VTKKVVGVFVRFFDAPLPKPYIANTKSASSEMKARVSRGMTSAGDQCRQRTAQRAIGAGGLARAVAQPACVANRFTIPGELLAVVAFIDLLAGKPATNRAPSSLDEQRQKAAPR
jgi:hypothetical protein